MKNTIVKSNNSLRLVYHFSKPITDNVIQTFFDWMGDYDVITAYELGCDVVCCNGEIYQFSSDNENELLSKGMTEINRIASLEDFIKDYCPDKNDFISWYY